MSSFPWEMDFQGSLIFPDPSMDSQGLSQAIGRGQQVKMGLGAKCYLHQSN